MVKEGVIIIDLGTIIYRMAKELRGQRIIIIMEVVVQEEAVVGIDKKEAGIEDQGTEVAE